VGVDIGEASVPGEPRSIPSPDEMPECDLADLFGGFKEAAREILG
jgi:hypothetical protein